LQPKRTLARFGCVYNSSTHFASFITNKADNKDVDTNMSMDMGNMVHNNTVAHKDNRMCMGTGNIQT